jgi:5-methylcytosine-specific restriction endonuclease McrA
LKALCPACDDKNEAARQRNEVARSAGYRGWWGTPEYKRQQRDADAVKEGRTLPPYLPQSERNRQGAMLQAERLAEQIRRRWAAQWLAPLRAALYQSDPLFREEKKARSRAEYWAHLDQSRLKTARYKREHRDLASLHEARRNRRIAEASDGTLTLDFIAVLKRRARRCAYCDSAVFPSDKVTDHMIPLCRGGEHSLRNLVICCRRCNARKARLSYAEWIERIEPEHRTRVAALYRMRYSAEAA